MSTEIAFTIIGTGIGVGVLNIALFRWLRADIRELSERNEALGERMTKLEIELRERMAKLEGLLEGLREAVSGRRTA